MANEVIHKPVLLKEVIALLDITSGGDYVDGTLGDGGYSLEIFRRLETGRLYSFDFDKESIEFVKTKYRTELESGRWMVINDNFSKLGNDLTEIGVKKIDGAVFDLGLSSRQLDNPSRGFSYRFTGDLDMRMDSSLQVKADDLLKVLNEKELTRIFDEFGEERYAKRIARAIKQWYAKNPDSQMSTDQLITLIRRVVPAGYREGTKNPARRVFQALRIAVNDELNSLKEGVTTALSFLKPNGRVVVVSYHSLEDRIVKLLFDEMEESGGYEVLTPKPVLPTADEIVQNPRSRSAKLRCIRKISS